MGKNKYTWDQLERIADDIRVVRDSHFHDVPISVMVILLRNLKIAEQELRILTETNNFLLKYCGEDSELYAHEYNALKEVAVYASFREISLDLFDGAEIPAGTMDRITHFIGGG